MTEPPPPPVGDELTLDEYLDDFETRFWRTDRSGGWKLERQQTFSELNNASWEAFEADDWVRAVALLEDRREDIRRYQQKITEHGFTFHRLRVVEKKYSPYLVWELNSLLIRCDYGDPIRTIPAVDLRATERGGQLPEIVALGSTAVYQVHYDHTGLAVGATRSLNPQTVRAWVEFIRRYYERGESLPEFFAREIAPLRPARVG